MNIAKNTLVTLHYKLNEVSDNNKEKFIESTEGGDPVTYLQGYQSMISGFENAVEGKQAGDSLVICLQPEEA